MMPVYLAAAISKSHRLAAEADACAAQLDGAHREVRGLAASIRESEAELARAEEFARQLAGAIPTDPRSATLKERIESIRSDLALRQREIEAARFRAQQAEQRRAPVARLAGEAQEIVSTLEGASRG